MKYFGLTSLQAIQCGTQSGALALKMAGQTGEIAPGMKADLLVVNGDPSKDIAVLGHSDAIEAVWVDGKPMDLSPPLPRKPIRGWALPSMGKRLTNPHIRDA